MEFKAGDLVKETKPMNVFPIGDREIGAVIAVSDEEVLVEWDGGFTSWEFPDDLERVKP